MVAALVVVAMALVGVVTVTVVVASLPVVAAIASAVLPRLLPRPQQHT